MFMPYVTEKTGRSTKPIDLPSRLLQDRIVYFGSGVDDFSANIAVMQLLWLNSDDPDSPIDMYINSPGGSVHDGLAVKDIMDKISAPVNTIGVGACSSMGAYLLSCGTGTRKALKNCRIMIHSVSSGTIGNYHDMKVDFKETEFIQNQMISDIASYTRGKSTREEIDALCSRDYYMSAEEAIELGLIDEIV